MKVYGSIAADVLEMGESPGDRNANDIIKLFKEGEKARFLIQVSMEFRPQYKNKLISVQLFRITGRGFGHADEMMRWCAVDSCLGIIPWDIDFSEAEIEQLERDGGRDKPTQWPQHLQNRVQNFMEAPCVCSVCGNISPREALPDSAIFQLPMIQLAERLEQIWLALEGRAEFYLVRFRQPAGIHQAMRIYKGSGFVNTAARLQYMREMEKARKRDLVHYPLKRLLKDISAGRSLASTIQSLLEA